MKTAKILVQKSETGLSEDNKAKLKSLEIYKDKNPANSKIRFITSLNCSNMREINPFSSDSSNLFSPYLLRFSSTCFSDNPV